MDEFDIWFDKGVTDGPPVVPPTRERVERMLAGTSRSRSEMASSSAVVSSSTAPMAAITRLRMVG